jgi:hypothetical protein
MCKRASGGVGDLHLGFDVGAAKAPLHDAFDALAYLGVVAVARHEHQAGVEAAITVTPHEQACTAPLVEVDDAAHDGNQLGSGGLEQFVAREGLDDVDHGLGVVALLGQAEVSDTASSLATQAESRPALVIGRSRSTGRGSGVRRSLAAASNVFTPT